MSATPRTDKVCCDLPPHGLTALIDALDFARQLEREIAKLKHERDEAIHVVKAYANRQNWGFVDPSGCEKGHGDYTESCFLGPEYAENILKSEPNLRRESR